MMVSMFEEDRSSKNTRLPLNFPDIHAQDCGVSVLALYDKDLPADNLPDSFESRYGKQVACFAFQARISQRLPLP